MSQIKKYPKNQQSAEYWVNKNQLHPDDVDSFNESLDLAFEISRRFRLGLKEIRPQRRYDSGAMGRCYVKERRIQIAFRNKYSRRYYQDSDPTSDQIKKAWMERSIPDHLWYELDYKIDLQKEWIEYDPDWKDEELDYKLALDDAIEIFEYNKDRKGINQYHKWLEEIGCSKHGKWFDEPIDYVDFRCGLKRGHTTHSVLDIVIHEMAHLKHPDHSKKFWIFCRKLESIYTREVKQ